MSDPNILSSPDPHLSQIVAEEYDSSHRDRFEPEELDRTVEVLLELAGNRPAVEFAVGTGRVAIPLAQRMSPVYGIDFSQPMIAELQKKPGAERVRVNYGNMASTNVCSDAGLVFLVYNTIQNLKSQREQIECFQNAASHLEPGGAFLIETMIPELWRLNPGETIIPFDVSPSHVGFSEYVDVANQVFVSHHYNIDGDRVRIGSPSFRYVWPSELDLMAELAGMTLESRWSDWSRSPFSSDSETLIAVWRKL